MRFIINQYFLILCRVASLPKFERLVFNSKMKYSRNLFFLLTLFFIQSCTGGLPVRNEVVVHESAVPEMLNPVNFVDVGSGYITNHIFQKLINVDFRNPDQFVPVLAENRPQIEKTPDGKMLITYHLRKEGRWDNGSPITAKDVEFSIKTIKCPLVNNPNAKPYFEFITDFKFYDDDPLKFTIISDQVYFLAEATFADISVLPEYVYDPKGLMKNFTVKQIAEDGEKLKGDAGMKEFADDFNSEKRMRDPDFIGGSGAYKFTEWKTNERIVLTKKENWWGDALEKENCYFEAYPGKLIFEIITDQATALVSLKAGNLDVMCTIKSKDFHELPNSEKFKKNFNAYAPMMFSYTYIGINIKSPLLSDKLTRQAFAHLLDVKKMIETLKYGQAQQVIGPVHPSKTKDYNSNIVPYDYNTDKAKELLAQAGWKNTNGDETLDKMIDGKQTEFVIDFYANSESDERKSIGLLLQAEAKKSESK
jgi:peptide/nickel transport system substrate-binding protein